MANDDSFLAPPDGVADWRLIVLLDAAAASGVLGRLPADAPTVAGDSGLDPGATAVLLDALAAWKVTERQPDGTYRAGPRAPAADEWPGIRHHARALRQWSSALDQRLRDPLAQGGPGAGFDPEQFLAALGRRARQTAPAVVDACLARFGSARTALDLGGGHGEYARELARRGLRVTMQDRPEMVEVVRRWGELERAGVELFAGDFFESLPPGPFDLVLVAGVTHTFGGARNAALYPRLRGIVSDGGGLVLSTFLRRRQEISMIFAVQMLVNGAGGGTHGEDEYREWLAGGGFALDEVCDLDGGQTLLFAPVRSSP